MPSSEPKRGVHPAIKLWVLFHMTMVFTWSLPKPPPAIMNGSVRPEGADLWRNLPDWGLELNRRYLEGSPLRRYMSAFGTWQYWDMFAPDPASRDVWMDAVITYQDGTVGVFEWPRLVKMSQFERYVRERSRKYLERGHSITNSWKWPIIAQRIALESWHDPSNPPTRVVLQRHFRDILPPDRVTPTEYKLVPFYDHTVDIDALRKAARR